MTPFDQILKEGSRSFYLSLRVLPPRLRPAMGTGYLVCRMADTIADTDIFPPNERRSALQAFVRLFDGFPELGNGPDEFKKKMAFFHFNGAGRDGRFFSQYPAAVKAFAFLSQTEKTLVSRVLSSVAEGMKMDLEKLSGEPRKVACLQTKQELEDYLTWIGGEPGRFWSALVLHHYPALAPERTDEWIDQGMEFGRGLQLINILRDIREDFSRGRCYIPEEYLREQEVPLSEFGKSPSEKAIFAYNLLIENALQKLQSGFFYLEKIPIKRFRLRAPVWWPLMIGLKTLGKLKTESALTAEKKIKISRGEVYRTLALSSLTLWSKPVMRWEFEDLASTATESFDDRFRLGSPFRS